MLFVIRIFNILVLLSALHTQFNVKDKSYFNKVFNIYLIAVLLHNFYVIPVYAFFPNEYLFIDYSAPWSIMYGALLYFCFYSYIMPKLKFRIILAHSIPIILLWLGYFILMFNYNSHSVSYRLTYLTIVYIAFPCSLFSYSLYILIKGYLLKKGRLLINKLAIYYILITAFMTLLVFYFHPALDTPPSDLSNISVSLFMSIHAILIFAISQQHLQGYYLVPAKVTTYTFEKNDFTATKEAILPLNYHDVTADKIEEFFSSESICNINLDLKEASRQLNMTQKDLRQMIRLIYNLSFTKLLTQKRIEYICKLLDTQQININFEELYSKCGFGSNATFYRNFKEQTGYSPKAYYERNI